MFKETPRLDEAQLARLSINGMLGGVEVLDACFGNAVLAPELVSLGAVLGVAVGYNVSAVSAANDEDFPHLVMWKFFLVPLYVAVAGLQHHVAVLTVVNCFENCLVSLVYPILGHGVDSAPLMERSRSVPVFRCSNLSTSSPVYNSQWRQASLFGPNSSQSGCGWFQERSLLLYSKLPRQERLPLGKFPL